ncbi:MAG: NADH-quinone oxidoreductase subunit A [Desulfobulbaceae bacterium]|nr:NADH-quinone oxidoreductase subunit A [Desulfobulbaceae bacterium]HKJ14359.1 NADH-quinone oxidoreductase subunit A [Desulfobulbales bacterium]MDH3541985.1 NADH-quinone oxidoreductase subunit A [Desulfobulbaceae bacterium]MDH3775659.1 NADH-quinone oxidoreductase subunit A [Desulfobulbaceae bacterium]MDH3781166.1 NADH-quinone oxidoreductase subunit A [Desulfobulbaceae bacterium]
MVQQPLLDHLYVAAFFLGGLLMAVGPFIIAHIFAPRSTRNISNKTRQLIECGVEPIGDAWIRFGIVYYLYALIFLAFDVDVLFLFPVALAYDTGLVYRDFVEILIFVSILSLALVYAWKKGVFKWERKTYSPR